MTTKTFVTIRTRDESYRVHASIEFAPNLVRHILKSERLSVLDHNGNLIGGNTGGLNGWYIDHPDIDTEQIKNILLAELNQDWASIRRALV